MEVYSVVDIVSSDEIIEIFCESLNVRDDYHAEDL